MDMYAMNEFNCAYGFSTTASHSHGLARGLFMCAMIAILSVLMACESEKQDYQAPPPPEVTVCKPEKREVTDYAEYTGNTASFESVDIRARVEGYLIKMAFKPGAFVKKGDLLFEIDPKPFQADLEGAQAQLETAKAQLDLAKATLIRKERAFKESAVSEVEVLEARAEEKEAKASILGGQAAVDQAKINLGYTKITAPIEGRVTRNMVDVGNLVGASETTLLANIADDDPIYAYFNISESDLLYYMKMHREGKTMENKQGRPLLYLGLSNEEGYPHEGFIDYADNTVDASTGTLQLRGIFDNSKRVLMPGLFVRLRIPLAKIPDALLVPEEALGSDQGGRYLLLVDDTDTVVYRRVTVGAMVDGMRVITEGLKPEDRVIVKGLQRARAGMKVTVSKEGGGKPADQGSSEGKEDRQDHASKGSAKEKDARQ